MVYLQIWEGKGVWGAWKPCFWLTLTCFAVRFTAKNGRYNCVSKYSTGWWMVTPYISGCWLEMDLLRPKYTKLDQRWANNSDRINSKTKLYSYLYLVLIFKPNVFIFVFGFYFWTEYIRIRIRFLFFDRIYSYSYSDYISKPNSIRTVS